MVYRDPAELLTSWQRWHSQLLARLARAPSPGEREAIRQEIAQHQAQYEGLAAAAAGGSGKDVLPCCFGLVRFVLQTNECVYRLSKAQQQDG